MNGPRVGRRQRALAGELRPGPGLSGGGVFQDDAAAEGFEPGDQAAGLAFGVDEAGEVVGAEFLIGFPVAKACATTTMACFLAAGLRQPPHFITCRWYQD